MQIHELINDDLSIHYLIHADVDDMKALQVAMRFASDAIEAADLAPDNKAALKYAPQGWARRGEIEERIKVLGGG